MFAAILRLRTESKGSGTKLLSAYATQENRPFPQHLQVCVAAARLNLVDQSGCVVAVWQYSIASGAEVSWLVSSADKS